MALRNIALLVLGILALSAGYVMYSHRQEALNYVRIVFDTPCDKPIAYTIGTIDPRFQLSREDVKDHLQRATELWSRAYGKTLFSYQPDDPNALPITFVYDRRQQTIAEGERISSAESSHESARLEIERARSAYQSSGSLYAQVISTFNTESKAYSEEVARINAKGGATAEEFTRLESERRTLNTRQSDLENKKKALDAQADALKAMITAYNTKVSDINKIVDTFNATAGGDFEEGQYVRDKKGERIYIYAYKTETELLHTLAHEFGHALGLEHNQNPASIMYAFNKSSVELSPEDLIALRAVCTKSSE